MHEVIETKKKQKRKEATRKDTLSAGILHLPFERSFFIKYCDYVMVELIIASFTLINRTSVVAQKTPNEMLELNFKIITFGNDK